MVLRSVGSLICCYLDLSRQLPGKHDGYSFSLRQFIPAGGGLVIEQGMIGSAAKGKNTVGNDQDIFDERGFKAGREVEPGDTRPVRTR